MVRPGQQSFELPKRPPGINAHAIPLKLSSFDLIRKVMGCVGVTWGSRELKNGNFWGNDLPASGSKDQLYICQWILSSLSVVALVY